MTNLVTKQLTMTSIFSGLPNNLIIDIIRIYNYRKKYDKVIEQINVVTTYDGHFCPSIRETFDRDGGGLGYKWTVFEIWGWDENRAMNDLNWINVMYESR